MALRYQEIKFQLNKSLSALKPGQKIPSRNFLGKKYGVARNTIDKAIQELENEGYLYSVKGSGTYVSKKNSLRFLNIGVILPSILGDVYPEFISGIENLASASNVNIILSSSDNSPEKQQANVARIIELQADGCIIIPIINSERSYDTFRELKKKQIPFVICHRHIDGLDAPFIGINNHQGSYMATRHLINQGCHQISYFSPRKYSTAIERYCGFETALFDCDSPVQKGEIILGNYSDDSLREKIRQVYEGDSYPDGVLCFDDTMVTILYQILQEKGLQIGKDVKVVGYDDSGLCHMLSVPLSSVSPQAVKVGQEAINLLINLISGKNDQAAFRLIPPKLILRKSSTDQ